MSNPFLQPETPPRSGGDQGNKTFKTPRTPARKLESLISPQTTLKNEPACTRTTGNSKKGVLKEPFTPEITPQRNTKGHKRRRSNIDIISTKDEEKQITETPRTDFVGLFMPTPSIVGSGRKVTPVTRGPRNLVHNFDSVSKLHSNLNLQEEIDEDKIDFLPRPSEIDSGFLRTSNLASLPKSPQPISSPTRGGSQRRRSIPETPTKQMIDDELRNEWYGRSKKEEFVGDDKEATSSEVFERIKGVPIQNPFISNMQSEEKGLNEVKLNATSNKLHEPIDYSKYAEYVNHKTGERKVVELLESQQRIKPKKLDFSGA